jgi:hypothetical protein
MYATWIIELGVLGALLAIFLAAETLRKIWFGLQDNGYWRVAAVGLMIAAGLGAFHQAHQSPGIWFVLGIVFGMGDRLPFVFKPRLKSSNP